MTDQRNVLVFDAPMAEGAWFQWKALGGRYRIRPLSPMALRGCRKAVGLPAYPPPGERLTEAQQQALDEEVLDHVVAEWDDIVDSAGAPVPCTRANKIAHANHIPGSLETWQGWARVAHLQVQAAARADLGNSSDSSPGESSTPSTSAPSSASTAGSRPAKGSDEPGASENASAPAGSSPG